MKRLLIASLMVVGLFTHAAHAEVVTNDWKLNDWKLNDWKLNDWKLNDWKLNDWKLNDWKLNGVGNAAVNAAGVVEPSDNPETYVNAWSALKTDDVVVRLPSLI